MAASASLWQGRCYDLEIIRFLEIHSRLVLAEGAMYPILNRLKAENLLCSRRVEAEAVYPRRYYPLADADHQRLRRMAGGRTGFAGALSRLLVPEKERQEISQ
jgi:DNA-binding PadR family transcriptional regulator